jgi:hypothetical protein
LRAYYDTSFLVSAYVRDANSDKAAAVVRKIKAAIPLTPLLRHELRNAIRLCVFRRDITPEKCRELFRDMEDDLRDGLLQEIPITWPELWRQAEALGARFAETLGVRGMDLLHVAAARAIGATDFFTYEARQIALAEKAGLKVRP